ALPSFPTLSDLSDPISSVLSGLEFVFFEAFRRVPTLSEVLSRISRLPVHPPGARRRRGLPDLAEP
ncbi:hypothetical protein, partial [Streptomyces tanashiensis]|uniref:hypothetical protein n=1 Tax=Streptomyces tanashiensis TaxID=67367 RepID=UPI001E55DDC1